MIGSVLAARRSICGVIGSGVASSSFVGAYDATPSIAAAYGMRRLRSAYTGSILRLRRGSDDAESDFGYTTAGDLDTAAISTWLGAASGYVVTWYDQSGNAYDATQATTASQPLYVASGQNGKPVVRFDGVNDYMDISLRLTARPYSAQIVNVPQSASYSGRSLSGGDVGVEYNWLLGTWGLVTPQLHGLYADGWVSQEETTNQSVGVAALDVGIYTLTSTRYYRNGVDQTVDSAPVGNPGRIVFGARTYTGAPYEFLNGDIAEILIANAALSTTDRQAAETAANTYWNIY